MSAGKSITISNAEVGTRPGAKHLFSQRLLNFDKKFFDMKCEYTIDAKSVEGEGIPRQHSAIVTYYFSGFEPGTNMCLMYFGSSNDEDASVRFGSDGTKTVIASRLGPEVVKSAAYRGDAFGQLKKAVELLIIDQLGSLPTVRSEDLSDKAYLLKLLSKIFEAIKYEAAERERKSKQTSTPALRVEEDDIHELQKETGGCSC